MHKIFFRKSRNVVFFFCCVLVSKNSIAQDDYYFTRGLSVNGVHRYGREALYQDKLAYKLYTKTLETPGEGKSLGEKNDKGEEIKWQPVKADSANRFRGRGFGGGGGYLYFTYTAEKAKTALLNISGNSGVFFNSELHAGDPYNSGWLYIPVKLKKGLNELYVRSGGMMTVKLVFPTQPIQVNTGDPTLPFIVLGNGNQSLKAAVVVINASAATLKNYEIKSFIAGRELTTAIPDIPAMTTRKVIFEFSSEGISTKGQHECVIHLQYKGKVVDEKKIMIDAVEPGDKYSETFVSEIDGSLQYYAVTPQSPSGPQQSSALFLSVHGAGVEAIGQARAYRQKDWGTLVAATNRRPRGFNWEDWGRLDALEVLSIAKQKLQPDPKQVYLTGHSMGGHGTWFLGATYPDKWAAIAPCAGYPTLKEYGSADGLIPAKGASEMEQLLLRASNQSDVPRLASNYKSLGVYIFHGDSDRTVSVNYARQMRKLLADFHSDMSYYEYPGGEHWFGDQSVDWKPIFDFFKWHSIAPDSTVDNIDFTTASPGISSSYRWVSVEQQAYPLQYSRIRLSRNKRNNSITGSTENIRLLKLKVDQFGSNAQVKIWLDSLNAIPYTTKTKDDSILLVRQDNQWMITGKAPAEEKGPQRYGTFKEPFNHRMVFVYGTNGNAEENKWNLSKAKYDAETWYYRGNGAVDIIADKEYSAKYAGRNVIIYGNATTNSVFNKLLSDCPLKIERNKVTVGNESWQGDDLAVYFTWPMKGSAIHSVGVVAGTGLKGMQAANANQYFAGASGFPDFMVFQLDMLQQGSKAIKMAGFFDNQWKLSADNFIINK
ncbi:alpha/beta hydrolase-fold protein [Terrimonas pollutisoli]|uniref:carboxylesterase family protein n=1 Tax=Terrimonas pollutisoli TaxID=3034147 RepID=UPI0023EDDBAE|nr:alpha/beta hydrolase-fold protein [Terrimonas sp. H1YJ31]